MKVAILGAGLSGLSCALMLERQGITPTIFDDRRYVGDRFINGEILLPILERPIGDPLAYLSEQYGLYLQPTNNITTLTVYSENEQALLQGQLGFINLRGRAETSYENQLAKQLETKIIFHSTYKYEDLLKDFTHIVMAVGDFSYTERIQGIRSDFSVTLKGATVSGRFNERETCAWLDHHLAPKGYGYLIPYSRTEANITLAYPEYEDTLAIDRNTIWQNFYEKVCQDRCQNLNITDEFEVTGYKVGISATPRIGNTLFIGNCFGSIMPFLGFGQFSAILSGIYAAEDLLGIADYQKQAASLYESYKNSLILRRSLEALDNGGYDHLVSFLDTKLANRLFNKRRINTLKLISRLLQWPIRFTK